MFQTIAEIEGIGSLNWPEAILIMVMAICATVAFINRGN